jgi:hypothetical protein
MEWSLMVERVEHVLGGATAGSSEQVVVSVLEEIGPWIGRFDLNQMRDLPDEALKALRSPREEPDVLDVDAVSRAVSERLGVPLSHAAELVPSVCRVVDEALDEEGRHHLRRNLPDSLVQTFERSKPHEATRLAGVGHTLADGEAGSRRPVSEADVAEEDSVAADDDPKGDTKLSGAKGIAQERRRRTLAEGKPGSTRSIADKKSD